MLCDRGYPSYDLLEHLQQQYHGGWVLRCPASHTFPAVETFVQSGKAEALLTLTAPTTEAIRLRAIRMARSSGDVSVLLTNLPDDERFRAQAVIDLYWRRWAVEVHDRDEKTSLDIETFHSHTENGIRQELFAMLMMAVIALVLMTDPKHPSRAHPQFKHAIITLASEAALLTPTCPDVALGIFQELLRAIERVRYYPPKIPRPSAPRVSKQPMHPWRSEKSQRMGKT